MLRLKVTTSQLVEVELPCNLCPFSLAKGDGTTKCDLTLQSFAYDADEVLKCSAW